MSTSLVRTASAGRQGSAHGGSHAYTEIEFKHVSSLLFFLQKAKKPKAAESVSKPGVSEGKTLKEGLILAEIRLWSISFKDSCFCFVLVLPYLFFFF